MTISLASDHHGKLLLSFLECTDKSSVQQQHQNSVPPSDERNSTMNFCCSVTIASISQKPLMLLTCETVSSAHGLQRQLASSKPVCAKPLRKTQTTTYSANHRKCTTHSELDKLSNQTHTDNFYH
jgi:hypothetical protein